MTDDKRFRSRRDMLTSAGRLYIGTVVAPALGSAALSLPAEATPAPHPNISEEQTEVTAGKVIDALEGAYGQHKGQRRNHAKGLGARGIFVGNPEAAIYSRSALFSGQPLEVEARFSLAGGDPEASDAEKSPRGLALEFRMADGGPHHITMIHTPMFFAAVPQTFLDKFIALAIDPSTGKPDMTKFKAYMASPPGQCESGEIPDGQQPASELRELRILRHPYVQVH